jgi:hypothetical protein
MIKIKRGNGHRLEKLFRWESPVGEWPAWAIEAETVTTDGDAGFAVFVKGTAKAQGQVAVHMKDTIATASEVHTAAEIAEVAARTLHGTLIAPDR